MTNQERYDFFFTEFWFKDDHIRKYIQQGCVRHDDSDDNVTHLNRKTAFYYILLGLRVNFNQSFKQFIAREIVDMRIYEKRSHLLHELNSK